MGSLHVCASLGAAACSSGGRLGPEPLIQGCPDLVFEGGGPAGSPQAENAPSTAEGQVKASSGQLLAE